MDSTLALVLERIFNTVFPLVFIVGLGYFVARKIHADMSVANRLNIDIFVPALIFSVMSGQNFDLLAHTNLIIGAALVVLGSGVLVFPLCRWIGVNPKTFVPPMMFNNSGNLGIPLIVLAFGEQALPAAIILFLTENLLHFTAGVYIMDRKTHPLALLKNPMILATLCGVCWSLTGLQLPAAVKTPVDMLGQISIPLMLFALGVRMTSVDFSNSKLGLWGALLSPLSGLMIAIPAGLLLQLDSIEMGYLIVFGALPPAILNYMIAERFNQEPHHVASIVLIANIASLVIIPIVLAFTLHL